MQRYCIINPADYVLGAGSEFGTQQTVVAGGAARREQETREQTPTGQVETKKQFTGPGGWATTANRAPSTAALPTLKYTSDGTDAIGLEHTAAEPKVFYATPGVIAASNTALAAVKADARLADAGGSMDAPKDPSTPLGPTVNLHMVKPGKSPVGGGTPTVVEKFGELADCNTFVKNVVGGLTERVAVFGQGAGHEALAVEEKEPTQDIANFAATGAGTAQDLGQHLKTTGVSQGSHDNPLPTTYTTMGGKQARDQSLGINAGANANVGEGYVITRGGDTPGEIKLQQYLDAFDNKLQGAQLTQAELDIFKHRWSYHYAGIVAKVGDDGISLENYNREQDEAWTVDDLYQAQIANVAGLRTHLNALAASGRSIPSIPKHRNTWFEKLAAELRVLGIAANANERAALNALDQVAAGAQGLKARSENLWHFKMYGTGVGQSFHEQWESQVDSPMTLRIRQSETLSRTRYKKALTTARNLLRDLRPSATVLRRLQALEATELTVIDQVTTRQAIQDTWTSGRTRAQNAIFLAMRDWATEAAGLSPGKKTPAVPDWTKPRYFSPADHGNYGKQLEPLLQAWESATKRKDQARLTKLGNLRQAIVDAGNIPLVP